MVSIKIKKFMNQRDSDHKINIDMQQQKHIKIQKCKSKVRN